MGVGLPMSPKAFTALCNGSAGKLFAISDGATGS